jgi:hypothetical protein
MKVFSAGETSKSTAEPSSIGWSHPVKNTTECHRKDFFFLQKSFCQGGGTYDSVSSNYLMTQMKRCIGCHHFINVEDRLFTKANFDFLKEEKDLHENL